MTTRKTKPVPPADLPPDVKPADLLYPKAPEYDTLAYREYAAVRQAEHGGTLTFYKVANSKRGEAWVICTLKIGSARRGSDAADRTYAVGAADGKVYTVGRGPHVKAVVTVYLHPGNLARLQKHVDAWTKGMAEAGQIRDRISSRRAQGQLHRAAGETYWKW